MPDRRSTPSLPGQPHLAPVAAYRKDLARRLGAKPASSADAATGRPRARRRQDHHPRSTPMPR